MLQICISLTSLISCFYLFAVAKLMHFPKQKELFGSFFCAYVQTADCHLSKGGHTYVHPICFSGYVFFVGQHHRVMNIFRNFAVAKLRMANKTYIQYVLQTGRGYVVMAFWGNNGWISWLVLACSTIS